jgi:hypothetical protein
MPFPLPSHPWPLLLPACRVMAEPVAAEADERAAFTDVSELQALGINAADIAKLKAAYVMSLPQGGSSCRLCWRATTRVWLPFRHRAQGDM